MKIAVIFHSVYGHIYQMAKAVVDGAKEINGADVELLQVKETLSDEIIEKIGATETKKMFADIPIVNPSDLANYDVILFGTPTRYGMMTAQMKTLIDATGKMWMEGAMIGKVGSVFTSSSTQHGGQESTILSFHTVLLHHGMVLIGVPYSEKRQMIMDEITGGSPYGASTIAGDGSRQPSENELEIAKFQGRHVAKIAKKIFD